MSNRESINIIEKNKIKTYDENYYNDDFHDYAKIVNCNNGKKILIEKEQDQEDEFDSYDNY